MSGRDFLNNVVETDAGAHALSRIVPCMFVAIKFVNGSYSPVWWMQRSSAKVLASAAIGVIVHDGNVKWQDSLML